MPSNVLVVELFCFGAWIVLLLPAVVYLATTWQRRRDNLLDGLTDEAIKLYYEQFYPSSPVMSEQQINEEKTNRLRLRRDFGKLYGRRHYILPILLLAALSGIGLLATCESIQKWLGLIATVSPFPPIAISAFLGAYAWVLFDQLARFRNGDFTAHDVYSGVYRFLIAVPLGISLVALLKDQAGVAVAFMLGAFPTATLFKVSRRLVSQRFNLGENEKGAELELEELQCIGRTNAERYLDEGITTIAELAWCNPIDLSIRTNREFNFVVDSVSQALLWVYFEDRVRTLYPLSLRGAQEVCSLCWVLSSGNSREKKEADTILTNDAQLMKMDKEALHFALNTVSDDPYAQFLFKAWN